MNVIKKIKKDKLIWEELKENKIKNYSWDKTGYMPKVSFKLAITNEGIKVKFIATEEELVIDKKESQTKVYQDSCVEFFFNPDSKNSNDYINLEINAIGTVLGQIGPNGIDRDFLTQEDIDMLEIKVDVNENNASKFNNFQPWCVEYLIPFKLIKKYYPKFSKDTFENLKCNFYKCGDKTKEAHYGSYFKIDYHKPSFHRPEFFGDFLIK
ncbi:MAG: carbohydrate-binding family 9-like protein [Sarcina sp.]